MYIYMYVCMYVCMYIHIHPWLLQLHVLNHPIPNLPIPYTVIPFPLRVHGDHMYYK